MLRMLLTAPLLVLVSVVAMADDFTVDGISYTILDSEALTCEVGSNTTVEGEVTIPGQVTVNDTTYTVVGVGANAFLSDKSITKVVLSDSITYLGYKAFYGCSALTECTLSANLDSLGGYSFYNCSLLAQDLDLSSLRVTSYSEFINCKGITGVKFSEKLETLGSMAFDGCTNLTGEISFPGLVSLGQYAFRNTAITGVTLPASLTTWNTSGYTFYGCASLEYVVFEEGFSAAIPNYAFQQCTSLKEVTIPEGVTSLAIKSFYDCTSLTTVTLPATLSTIKNMVFQGSDAIEDVYVYGTSVPSGTTSDLFDTTTLNSAALHTLPGYETTWTSNKYWAFGIAVDDINNPDTMSVAGYITSVTPEEGTVDSLASVAITFSSDIAVGVNAATYGKVKDADGNKVSGVSLSIDSDVLTVALDSTLTVDGTYTVTIPKSALTAKSGTLLSADTLTYTYTIGEETPDKWLEEGDTVLSDDGLIMLVYELDGTAGKLYVAKQSFEGDLVIPGTFEYSYGYDYTLTVDSITASAFINDSTITTLYIPNTVKGIGVYAFRGSEITSVEFEDGDTPLTLGSMVFGSCSSLASVTLPGRLSVIPSSTFLACSALSEVTIPEGVTTIEKQAFGTCTGLTSIEIPGTVKSLNGFNACTSLSSVTLNEGIESIEDYAFVNDSLVLTSITIPSTVTYLSGFQNCWALSEVNLESTSVTEIGDYAFYNCKSLPIIELNEGLESIGQYAFAKAQLDSVTFPSTLKTIDMGAFYGTSVYAVTLPESLTSLGYGAFLGCSSLVIVTFPEGIESVALCAFDECYALQDVVVVAANPPSTDNSLLDSDDQDMIFTSTTLDTATLHVIEGATENYTSNKYWAFATVLEDALSDDIATAIEGVSATGDAAFSIDAAGNISFAGLAEGSTVAIYNAAGQLVTRATASGSGTIAAALRSGSVYIVKVESDGESTVQKIAF